MSKYYRLFVHSFGITNSARNDPDAATKVKGKWIRQIFYVFNPVAAFRVYQCHVKKRYLVLLANLFAAGTVNEVVRGAGEPVKPVLLFIETWIVCL